MRQTVSDLSPKISKAPDSGLDPRFAASRFTLPWSAYVRLLADPDAPAAPGALAPIAAKLDAYLAGAAK